MLIVRDWMGHRGPFVLLCITWNVIAYPCLRTTSWDTSRWHRYGVIAVANVSYISMQYVLSVPDLNGVLTSHSVLNVGWLSVYCKRPQERSVAMA